MRRIALILAFATAAAPALEAQNPPGSAAVKPQSQGSDRVNITADGMTTDYATGDSVLTGNAQLVDPGLLLTADKLIFHNRTQVAEASGHVVLTRVGDRILADTLTYDRVHGSFTAKNLRI